MLWWSEPALPALHQHICVALWASCKSCRPGRKTGSVQTRCILGVQLPECPLSVVTASLGCAAKVLRPHPFFFTLLLAVVGEGPWRVGASLSFHVAKPFCGRGELGRGRGLEAARASSGSSAVSQAPAVTSGCASRRSFCLAWVLLEVLAVGEPEETLLRRSLG